MTGKYNKERLKKIISALSGKFSDILKRIPDFRKKQTAFLQNVEWKSLPSKLWVKTKKIKLQKTATYKFVRKCIKKLSDSWKVILTVVPLFLIFYYGLGTRRFLRLPKPWHFWSGEKLMIRCGLLIYR